MYVLVLVDVLERRVLSDDGLEELKQLALEVGLAADRATFLRVATDDAQRGTVIKVAGETHVVLLDNLLDKIILGVTDDSESQKMQDCVAFTVRQHGIRTTVLN